MNNFDKKKSATDAQIVYGFQRDDELHEKLKELTDFQIQREAEEHAAIIQNAENTADIHNRLENVIENQKDQIKLLQNQNEMIKDIFESDKEQTIVVNEIWNELLKNDNDGKWSLVKDKMGDVAVTGVLEALKTFLTVHHILF